MKFRDLTAARFALFNAVCFGLFGWAWFAGWAQMVLENDASYITWVIGALFAIGWFWCACRVAEFTSYLNETSANKGYWLNLWRGGTVTSRDGSTRIGMGMSRTPALRESIQIRLASKIAPVRQMAGILVILGLIGTVVGFIMATQALDMAAVGDTDRAAAMLGDLMAGMGVALYTTLCGAVASIWLMTCYRILQGAANSLAARVFES